MAASPCCHPTQRRMHSSASCAQQAHSPAVATLQRVRCGGVEDAESNRCSLCRLDEVESRVDRCSECRAPYCGSDERSRDVLCTSCLQLTQSHHHHHHHHHLVIIRYDTIRYDTVD